MKMNELTCTVNKYGKLKIPEHILWEMDILPGESVRLAYLTEDGRSNTYSEFMLSQYGIEDAVAACEFDQGSFSIPADLMEAANIPQESDISIACLDGAIIITGAGAFSAPDELEELVSNLGYAPENIRVSYTGGNQNV